MKQDDFVFWFATIWLLGMCIAAVWVLSSSADHLH